MRTQALKGLAVAAFIVMLGVSLPRPVHRCFGKIFRLTSWSGVQRFRPAPTP